MRFLAGCAQFAPKKADVRANLDSIAQFVREAAAAKVDVLVFPESATSGYYLEGGVLECSLTASALQSELASRLGGLNSDIDFCLGFYEEHEELLYNSAAYFSLIQGDLKLVQIYRKIFLPTYGTFDEDRFVSRGTELPVFDTRFGKVAILICEDIWHSIMPTLVALQGAQVLLVPSASPARGFKGEVPGNVERYERLLKAIAEEHSIYVLNSMLCGFEGGKGFAGVSSITDAEGEVIAKSPMLEPHLLVSEVDLDALAMIRANSPLLSDLKSKWPTLVKIINNE